MNSTSLGAAWSEIEIALRLDPESPEINQWAGLISASQRRIDDAIAYWTKAAAPADANFWTLRLLAMALRFKGDMDEVRPTSQRVVTAAQEVLEREPDNGLAMGSLAEAFVNLGEGERAREMVALGMLLDPDNILMTTCFVRAMALLPDFDAALDVLEHAVKSITRQFLSGFFVWPDMAALR